MSDTRTTTIHLDATQITRAIEHTCDRAAFHAAIGYLSTWNYTFPTCDIYSDGEADLIAIYKHADGTRGYAIGAIWHGDHYGFHS